MLNNYLGQLIIRDTLLTQDTPLFRTPHYSGHLAIQDASLFRTPHYSGHPTIQDTHYSGHFTIQDASLFRTLHYSGRPTIQDTSLFRTLHYSGRLTIQDTPLFRTPHYSGHFTIQDASLFRMLHYSGRLTIQDTPLFRTPHYSGHPTIQDTSLFRTQSLSPQRHMKVTNTHHFKQSHVVALLLLCLFPHHAPPRVLLCAPGVLVRLTHVPKGLPLDHMTPLQGTRHPQQCRHSHHIQLNWGGGGGGSKRSTLPMDSVYVVCSPIYMKVLTRIHLQYEHPQPGL